jgi:hypothetical protein
MVCHKHVTETSDRRLPVEAFFVASLDQLIVICLDQILKSVETGATEHCLASPTES